MFKRSSITPKVVLSLALVTVALMAAGTASARDSLARAPRVGFVSSHTPNAAHPYPSLYTSFYVVDTGGGVGNWQLERHVAKLTSEGCQAWRVDSRLHGSRAGSFSAHDTLVAGYCYFWTLQATDSVGETSQPARTPITQLPQRV